METIELTRAICAGSGLPALVYTEGRGAIRPIEPGEDAPEDWMSAKYAAAAESTWFVYPSGLAIPLGGLNWFWEYEDELRQGTARQAVAYANKRGLDPALVRAVSPDRVHGVYIRYDNEKNPRRYDLVYASPFPSWTWKL